MDGVLTDEEKLKKVEAALDGIQARRGWKDYYSIDWPVTTRAWSYGFGSNTRFVVKAEDTSV